MNSVSATKIMTKIGLNTIPDDSKDWRSFSQSRFDLIVKFQEQEDQCSNLKTQSVIKFDPDQA